MRGVRGDARRPRVDRAAGGAVGEDAHGLRHLVLQVIVVGVALERRQRLALDTAVPRQPGHLTRLSTVEVRVAALALPRPAGVAGVSVAAVGEAHGTRVHVYRAVHGERQRPLDRDDLSGEDAPRCEHAELAAARVDAAGEAVAGALQLQRGLAGERSGPVVPDLVACG